MMKSSTSTPILFFSGTAGLLISCMAWFHTQYSGWLLGVTVFTGLTVWSIAEAILATNRDLQELRRHATLADPPQKAEDDKPHRPLRQNPYFRAGVMGLPFCIFEWFWKHELVFLLGGGFFAGILIPTVYSEWRWKRSTQNNPNRSINK